MATALPPRGALDGRPASQAYGFVTRLEGEPTPLRLEIDCDSDREATLLALAMARDLTSIEVWNGRSMICRVPTMREAMQAGRYG